MRSSLVVLFGAAVLTSACVNTDRTSPIPPEIDAGEDLSDLGLDAGVTPEPDLGVPEDAGDDDLGPADTGVDIPDLGPDDRGVEEPDAGPDDLGPEDLGPDAGPIDIGTLPREITFGTTARPATLIVPDDYDGTPHPLVVLIHGLGSNGGEVDTFFGMSAHVDDRDFFLLLPNGSTSNDGTPFWNATPECCNYDMIQVDDVAYITGLIDDVSMRVNIDSRRVYATGHSNGGFMSYRLACDVPQRFAAIAPLAGMEPNDPTLCTPSEAVSVLHSHGTDDEAIPYDGLVENDTIQYYPPAEDVLERWAARGGCDTTQRSYVGTMDASVDFAGDDTDIFAYQTGCRAGLDFILWRMNGEVHLPSFSNDYVPGVLDFLLSHSKP